MSSKVFRVWPALALALLLAAVWHWGVPVEPVRAQDSGTDPVLDLLASTLDSDNVVVSTDVLSVTASNFGKGRVWLYLWTRASEDDEFPGCPAVAVDANLRDDGLLDESGGISFTMEVTAPPFVDGPGNRFCLVRRDEAHVASEPFSVDVRPSTYLMRLELNSVD